MSPVMERPTGPVKEEDIEGFRASLANLVPPQFLKQGWEIPVIDLARLRGIDRQYAVHQIAEACQEWGFFHVVNHGVPEELLEDMWKAHNELFQVPLDERCKFDSGSFLPPAVEKKLAEMKERAQMVPDWRDTIRFRGLNPEDEGNIADAPPSFRKCAYTFYRVLRDIGFELLEAISESLGKEKNFIRNATGNNAAINTSLHCYLPCSNGDKTLGITPHRDADTITMLLQDQTGGLQVLKEDRWVVVQPLLGSLVVNLGEVIQAITNGLYKSALHRVMLNEEKKRLSIACFLLPTPEAIIEPVPELVSEEEPALYPTCTWEEFYYNHFAIILKL